MIVMKNLLVRYGSDKPVIQNLSGKFASGMCTFLTGQSGAGKTSLLRSISGLQDYDGEIEIQGKNLATVTAAQRPCLVGYVFQQFNLFPTLTVLENCMQPLSVVLRLSEQEASARAKRWLQRLGLADFYDRLPEELSGGQQQRVALARALCFEPACLLLDEPTSSLDAGNTTIIGDFVKELCGQGKTVVIASHDEAFVRLVADEMYLFENGNIQRNTIL